MRLRILFILLLSCLPLLAAARQQAGLRAVTSDTAIVLSEIMYDQPTTSTSDEFIELYNCSATLP
ncbi:MAG: lamin tail domain-containing protein, partial [Chlorobiales bacterium]|nr:lamin tail domain-containing protein [Chlorobiales bacterium]